MRRSLLPKALLCGAVFSCLGGVPLSSAYAQSFGGPGGFPPEGERGGAPGQQERMTGGGKLFEQLNLTEDQQAEIASIRESYRSLFDEQFQAVKAARDALRQAIEAEQFDETAIRQAAKQKAAAEEELAVLQGSMRSEIRSVLTAEQIEQMEALQSQARTAARATRRFF